jgi:hypothetical protein
MDLREELERIAERAVEHAGPGEELAAVLPADSGGARVYLCAFRNERDENAWLLLDAGGTPVEERVAVREAASLIALCEVAVDSAGGGGLDELRSQLVGLRLTENPEGVDEAIVAVDDLELTLGAPPYVASTEFLERVGVAVRALEASLGSSPGSPFATALQAGTGAIEQFTDDVVAKYKRPLE